MQTRNLYMTVQSLHNHHMILYSNGVNHRSLNLSFHSCYASNSRALDQRPLAYEKTQTPISHEVFLPLLLLGKGNFPGVLLSGSADPSTFADVGKNHRNVRPGFESRLHALTVITYVKHKPSHWVFTSSSAPRIELQTVSLILKCLVLEKLSFKAGSHYVAPTGLELTKSTSYFAFF